MGIWDILLIGVALSMDAFAAGLTDGMREAHMGAEKMLLIAATFGIMQCVMPLMGYCFGELFSAAVAAVAPWLSFALLALIGGKAVAEFFKDRKASALQRTGARTVGTLEIAAQGIATSLDALAVGITFLAAETSNSLPMSAVWCAAIIGVITFSLSLAAVIAGKKMGDRFADKAKLLGGIVLIAIGIKILLEGLL